jgi:hypothetical protein
MNYFNAWTKPIYDASTHLYSTVANYFQCELYVWQAVRKRDNETFKNVKHISSNASYSVYPTEEYDDDEPLFDLYNFDEVKEATEGFFTFSLPTNYNFLGHRVNHNVGILYNVTAKRLYIIDGKAVNPETLHFQDRNKGDCPETVSMFVAYLKAELNLPGDFAYCKMALQRSNDCVIFAEKVIADLLKDPAMARESAQDHLNRILSQAEQNSGKFYAEISRLRGQCFDYY